MSSKVIAPQYALGDLVSFNYLEGNPLRIGSTEGFLKTITVLIPLKQGYDRLVSDIFKKTTSAHKTSIKGSQQSVNANETFLLYFSVQADSFLAVDKTIRDLVRSKGFTTEKVVIRYPKKEDTSSREIVVLFPLNEDCKIITSKIFQEITTTHPEKDAIQSARQIAEDTPGREKLCLRFTVSPNSFQAVDKTIREFVENHGFAIKKKKEEEAEFRAWARRLHGTPSCTLS